MAKITEDQRNQYLESVKFYKKKIEDLMLEQKKLRTDAAAHNINKGLLEIKLTKISLSQITIYCGMNEASIDLLEVKNTAFLDKARQLLFEVLINMGSIVSNYLDVPFSEYSDKLQLLDSMTDKEKLNLIKEIGICSDLIKKSFGDNTKWKWSFIDTDGRFAIIAKNIFDLRRYQKLDQPTEAGFRERRAHLSTIQKLLFQASQGYREKYELSTKDIEDLKKAIDFQKALLRINSIIGDTEKIDNGKKQIDVWTTLLEKHLIEMDEKKRKRPL